MRRSATVLGLYLAWSWRDGLHVVRGDRWHFHAFLWWRGHRRNPLYVSLRR